MEFNATFIITAISFILFTIIMNKIFYSPIEKIVDEREHFINEALGEAENSKKRTSAILTDRENKLNKSLENSRKLISDKVNEANENSKSMTMQAKQQSQEQISSAKSSLKEEAENTTSQLKEKVKDLAEVISSKILGMDTKIEKADSELINRILN